MAKKTNRRSSISVIFVLMVLFISIIGTFTLTGCGGGSPSGSPDKGGDGFEYISLKDFNEDNYITAEMEDFMDNTEGWALKVYPGAPEDLVIPDLYEGLPVYIVTSGKTEGEKYIPRSVAFGKNVKAVYYFLNDVTPDIKELVIPENVEIIEDSFSQLDGTTVFLEGKPDIIVSFKYARSTRIVVSSADDLPRAVKSILTPVDYVNIFGIEVGTEDLLDYSDAADRDLILEKGAGHFREELDPDKEVAEMDALLYAGFLDGPVVTMDVCPEIDYSTYFDDESADAVKGAKPKYISVANMAGFHPEEIDLDGLDYAPKVYFIAEKMGGKLVRYTGEDDYLMVYRISVRDIETDELICWFEAIPGDAPDTKPAGSRTFKEGGRTYMTDENNKDTTAEYCIYTYFN